MIAQRLKLLRKQHRITQEDLAAAINVERSSIGKYESATKPITPPPDVLIKIATFFNVSVDYLLGYSTSSVNAVRVPVLGDVAAGIPMDAVENIVDYEEIDSALAATGDFFGLRIKGDSMEPRIREGDVVIVRKQEDADTGDTAVVLVNGSGATVKRVKKEPGGISLIPNNPAFDTMYYSAADIAALPVTIVGKVVELRGKF